MPFDTFFNLPEDKRARLLDVLLDEFSQNDYKNVSVGRVAERAGVSKGSFYQYFADKKDCYLYLIELGVQEKTAFLAQAAPAAEADLFARLRWLLNTGMQFQMHQPRLAQIAYKALFDDVPLPAETLAAIRSGAYPFFYQMVQAGLQNGSLNPALDPDLAAFILNTVFTNLGQHLMTRFAIAPEQLLSGSAEAFDQAAVRETIEQVIRILETGLSAPGK